MYFKRFKHIYKKHLQINNDIFNKQRYWDFDATYPRSDWEIEIRDTNGNLLNSYTVSNPGGGYAYLGLTNNLLILGSVVTGGINISAITTSFIPKFSHLVAVTNLNHFSALKIEVQSERDQADLGIISCPA